MWEYNFYFPLIHIPSTEIISQQVPVAVVVGGRAGNGWVDLLYTCAALGVVFAEEEERRRRRRRRRVPPRTYYDYGRYSQLAAVLQKSVQMVTAMVGKVKGRRKVLSASPSQPSSSSGRAGEMLQISCDHHRHRRRRHPSFNFSRCCSSDAPQLINIHARRMNGAGGGG